MGWFNVVKRYFGGKGSLDAEPDELPISDQKDKPDIPMSEITTPRGVVRLVRSHVEPGGAYVCDYCGGSRWATRRKHRHYVCRYCGGNCYA